MSTESAPLAFAQRPPSPTEGSEVPASLSGKPRALDRVTRSRRPLNACATCGLDFASLSAFDAHRIGTHAYPWSLERPDGRRCLTEDELRARGFTLDTRGRWRRPTSGREPWSNR